MTSETRDKFGKQWQCAIPFLGSFGQRVKGSWPCQQSRNTPAPAWVRSEVDQAAPGAIQSQSRTALQHSQCICMTRPLQDAFFRLLEGRPAPLSSGKGGEEE